MRKTISPYTPCVCPGRYDHLKLTLFYINIVRNSSNEQAKDQYGLVCKIHSYNGEIISNGRYTDFPLPKST